MSACNSKSTKMIDKEEAQNDAIRCRACKHWIHYACAQMNAIYIMILADTNLMFFCMPCIYSRVTKKVLNNNVPDGSLHVEALLAFVQYLRLYIITKEIYKNINTTL